MNLAGCVEMRKKVIVLGLSLFILLFIPAIQTVEAEEKTELNIYAMYLGEGQVKGDSVLLESEGNYLLVDLGRAVHAPVIIRQLQKLNVTNVDVMFSHLHGDHIGAVDSRNITEGLEQLNQAGIMVDTMYLPSPSLSRYSQKYPYRYGQLRSFMTRQGCGQIVYLNTGDSIQFGDVTGNIIGPLDPADIYPGKYTQYADEDDRYTEYENNCSLAVIFTCGSTRFFTAGDCYADEAAALVEKYGETLKCDIMKLCHHGVGGGNTSKLIKAVQPSYSFALNTGMDGKNEITGRWRSYAPMQRATKYGMCYLVGNEKKTLIYHIVNDEITLYRGQSLSEGKKLTGWQYLYGADGVNRDHDMYYLDSDCKPVTGIRKIDNHYYLFSDGGKMEYGDYSEDGEYLGWKTCTDGKRYFELSANKKYAFMCLGIQSVNGKFFYFDQDGFQLTGEEDDYVSIEKIGSNYYALDHDGEITVNDWEEVDGEYYYFDKSGKMIQNCVYRLDGDYYIFNKNGQMFYGENGTKIISWKLNTYAVREDGTLVTGGCKKVKGSKYYFNSKGVIQKNKIIKIGKKKYYFGKNGKMACNCKFKLNGKTYIANGKGEVSSVSKKK